MPDNVQVAVPVMCPRRAGYPHEFSYRGNDGLWFDLEQGNTIVQVYFCKWCLCVERRQEPEWQLSS